MANISAIKVGNTSYGITATPTAHASTATTYGAASASKYGHVKLSDNYTSSAGAAASGIGASSAAVYNAYNTLNSNLRIKMPDYNNLTFIVDTAITEPYHFTATEDGWLHINVQGTPDEIGQARVAINDSYVFILCAPKDSEYLQQSQLIPIRKNDRVECGLASGRIRNIIFVPNV